MSTIEWTGRTWGLTAGCTRHSPGCEHCYAEIMSARQEAMAKAAGRESPYAGTTTKRRFNGTVVLRPEKLLDPLKWTTPQLVFVNSMSDLFHDKVHDDFIAKAFDVMKATPWHTYQILTKRTARMVDILDDFLVEVDGPPDHIWCGTSVEDRKRTTRIDEIRDACAAVRWLSIEPLIEDLGPIDLTGIHWIVVGGESGPGARPMEFSWVRKVHEEAIRVGARFFFKQWGGVRKKKAGRLLGGRTWDEMPEIGPVEVPPRPTRKQIRGDLLEAWGGGK